MKKRDPLMTSYPGGKSGAGIYQRIINLIPPHEVFISAFAGHCGIVRNIKPAKHTIVIDKDPDVCDWWRKWSRTKHGRALEVVHGCGIAWLAYTFGVNGYNKCIPTVPYDDIDNGFIFCDPPYVLSERAHGKQYAHEMTDEDHRLLLRVLRGIPWTITKQVFCDSKPRNNANIMVCGYVSPIYAPLESWFQLDHRVPTRGGLQDERIWMTYDTPKKLHDYRYIGNTRRQRERIRRRQRNWRGQLSRMSPYERAAMLEVLNQVNHDSK